MLKGTSIKIAAIYLIVLCSFIMLTSQNSCADLRGPRVMGLQLGMSGSEAEAVIKKIAADEGAVIESAPGGADATVFKLYKDEQEYILCSINHNELTSVTFRPIAFNTTGITTDFIKQFLAHYHIKVDKNNISEDRFQSIHKITLTNPVEGYKLDFSIDGYPHVAMSMIKKSGPVQFK